MTIAAGLENGDGVGLVCERQTLVRISHKSPQKGTGSEQTRAAQRFWTMGSVPVPFWGRSILLVRRYGDRHVAVAPTMALDRYMARRASPRNDSS